MSKIKTIGLALIVLALLIPTAMALAKGLQSMDISGPGIDGTMHLDNLDEMNDLMDSSFFDQTMSYISDDTIAELGEGYEITFYFAENPEDEPFHMEKVVYYPDPEGGRGYIHWLGGGDPAVDIMEPDSTWSRVPERGETAFWLLMEAHGVTRPEIGAVAVEAAPVLESAPEQQPAAINAEAAEPAADISSSAAPTPETSPINWAWIAGAVLAVLIAAAAWVIRQRQHKPATEASAASD